MNKLTAYTSVGIPITELDISETETAPFTYRLADIRAPEKKGGAFSKTIRLPGTPTNNRFFGGLYDVNVSYTTFNPNLKTFVRWVSADEETISGHMKLGDVYVDEYDEVWYEVTLYDTSVDFWSNIEGKFVFELSNIGELSHVWNGTNIKASWTTDWNQRGYFYPTLKNSLGAGNAPTVTYTERLYPAAFHMRLLDMVIRSQGYTWSGTLKTNAVYQREIIPYTGDHPNLTLTNSAARTFKVGWNSNQVGNSNFYPSVPNSGKIPESRGTVTFPDETGGSYGFNDNNGIWASHIYTAPENGKYAFNMNLLIRATMAYYKDGNPVNAMDYKVRFNVYAEINTGSGTVLTGAFALNDFDWYIAKDAPDTSLTFVDQNQNNNLVFPASVTLAAPYTNGNYFVLQSGWTIRFYLGYNSDGMRRAKNGNPLYYGNDQNANEKIRIEQFYFRMNAGSFVECNDSLSNYGEGFLIPYQAFINKNMKQKDLFTDIIARYNAHIYMNPDVEKDIVIDTGETFYDPAPEEYEDWSDLKETDENDKITHLTEIQNERINLTYSESGDAFTKSYKTNTGEIYGQHEHRFANAFVKGVRTIQTPFVDTPIIEINRMFFPNIEKSEKDGAMRVLYAPKGGIQMKEYSSSRYFVLNAADGQHTLGVSGSFYPYAGHLQNPNRVNDTTVYNVTDDNDINFGTLAYLFPQMLIGVSSLTPFTLEHRYYQRRIDQMNQGKMLTTLLNLTSRHIQKIRKKPFTRIWINRAWWQVNLINYEGNDQLRKLTPVELISLHNLRHIKGRPIKPVRPTLGSLSGVLGTINSGTNTIGNGTINADIKGVYNAIGENSKDVFIEGNENTVGSNLVGVKIVNSNNVTVRGSNVTVIDTSDITIHSSDVTVIRGVLYYGDQQVTLFNMIDGGEDEIRAINSPSKINLIDPGKNINLNRFPESPITLIDSQDGINNSF